MSTHFFFRSLMAASMLMAVSCAEEDIAASIDDLSESAKDFINMRLASPGSMNAGNEAAINGSFQNMMVSRFPKNGRTASDSTDNDGGIKDSVIYVDPWISCAEVTTEEKEDGSTTTIIDYGDGCNEGWGGYFMKGRLEQTYKYVSQKIGSAYSDNYLFTIFYVGYGGGFEADSTRWQMDGNSRYQGTSEYDTLSQKFSGNYQYSDTTLYQYANTVYNYKSRGRSSYDENGWIVEESEYEYKDGNDFYRSLVVEPLITSNDCNVFSDDLPLSFIWVPVSGKEKISYKQDGKQGSFEVDYGNGECDNIIYILENGKRVKIDLSSDWGAKVSNKG